MIKKLLVSLLCVAFVGCSFIPKYERPSLPVSSTWPNGQSTDGKAFSDVGWSVFYSDARLQKLIELALNNNRNLRVAALNVDLLRAQYRIGVAGIIPSVNATGNGLRQRDVSSEKEPSTTGKYSIKLGITSYELDFFGRVRSLKRQALERYLATQEARRSVQITLIAEVATQYYTERALHEQWKRANETLKSVKEYYKLIKSSYSVGNASELDLRSAEGQVQAARADIAHYVRLHAQALNGLMLLVGQGLPNDLPQPQPFGSISILENIPAGLPSDLMTRRPDILAAEHQLLEANANIGAARAAFFPQIVLTANNGVASAKLMDLFTGSYVWSFAPQITMPIFDSGRNAAILDAAKITKSIEVAQYEQAIQVAFREVSDALVANTTYDDQIKAQQALEKSQQQRFDLADVRYRNGVDSYLTVLIAQQDLYRAQQSLIQSQLARISNTITLYKALGGGWEKEAASNQK